LKQTLLLLHSPFLFHLTKTLPQIIQQQISPVIYTASLNNLATNL